MVDQANGDAGSFVRVELSGSATVREAEGVFGALTEGLRGHDRVEIDCGGVTEADLSLVQLLLSARRSASESGRTVALAGPAEGALRKALLQGGFLSEGGGAPRDDETFWLEGRDAR